MPELDEFEGFPGLLVHFKTIGRIFREVERSNDSGPLDRSAGARRDDITVAFALQLFSRRRRFRDLDERLRRDIKAFFGTYENAQRTAVTLLNCIGDAQRLRHLRDEAASVGLGHVEEEGHLQLQADLVCRLPPELRVFAGAATAAYGDLTSADLLKLHVESGKVTLMSFEDFATSPLPRMVQRVKVDLRDQEVHVFDYGNEFEPPYLYWKSRYINEETEGYADQLSFDEQLASLGVVPDGQYGPAPNVLQAQLRQKRLEIRGFELVRSTILPDLDEQCGRYLTFRQLIECGDTWEEVRLDNRPRATESYNALYDLAVNVLDPVIEYFGMVKLTYGFCSSPLAKHVKGRIAPKLDQHIAHELGRGNQAVCSRLGSAADFLVEYEDMREVGNWIIAHTQFDRIYFYGSDRPIHVSYGPDHTRSVFEMSLRPNGKLIPRRRTAGL